MKTMAWTIVVSSALLAAACKEEQRLAPDDTQAATRSAPTERAPPTPVMPEGTGAANGDAAGRAMLKLSQGSPSYLVDASGASLYFLEGNAQGTRCDATCEQAWPPVVAGDAGTMEGVQSGLLGRLQRADGRTQLTYARQPLYRYAGDAGAGRTSGHGVSDKWGQWALMAPDGHALAHDPPMENPAERTAPTSDDVP